MNILIKVYCFFYLLNRKHTDRNSSVQSAFLGLGAVVFWNIIIISEFLKIWGIRIQMSYHLALGGLILIYSVLAIYFFLFKKYKIVDENDFQKYSPWKRPVIWGGIYIILLVLVSFFVF